MNEVLGIADNIEAQRTADIAEAAHEDIISSLDEATSAER